MNLVGDVCGKTCCGKKTYLCKNKRHFFPNDMRDILNKPLWSEMTWHTTKYGDLYSEFVLCIYPILSAHTQQWTHTHHEHTPGAVGSHLCCGARGAVGGSVSCSRAPQSWYWGWRECCTFTPPTYNSCRTWDSNPQPLNYESDSLTIRPWLPFLSNIKNKK